MIYLYALSVIVASFVICASQDPQFEVLRNPGCKEDLCANASVQLIYGRLQRSADSLHVFVSVGEDLGDLSVSYLQSDDPKQLATVDWHKIFSGEDPERASALTLSNPKAKSLARFSVLFSNLVEYSDKDNTANPNDANASMFRYFPLGGFLWQLQEMDNSHVVLLANSTTSPSSSSIFQSDGYLRISVELSPSAGRGASMPQLQFTGNNTQVEVAMFHLASNLTNARFYLEAALIDSTERQQKLEEFKNIDDEYTPGIFKVTDWVSDKTCYVQWKPVCYKAEPRTIGSSTVVAYSSNNSLPAVPSPGMAEALNASFVYVLLGGSDPVTVGGARAANITFGLTDDKFYADTSYAVWTMSIGLGEPPSDSVSSLVIVVILCGLGLPALLMSAALVYLCVRRLRAASGSQASAYQPINA